MDQRYKSKRKIFVDPQIKEVMNDRNSDEVLDGTKETAWEAFLTLEADAKRLSTGSWLQNCGMQYVTKRAFTSLSLKCIPPP